MKIKCDNKKVLLSFLLLIPFLNGCIPSYTHYKGDVSIQVQPASMQSLDKNSSDRFIIISFWDYPSVNGAGGKIVINKVVLSEDNQISIDFPHKGYWVIWTPALGTQHITPEPGVIVFHENYLPSWSVGGTDNHSKFCCAKPMSHRIFQLELIEAEKSLLQTENLSFSGKIFLEKLLAAKKNVIKKMDRCKVLSAGEKAMVLEKLSRITESVK